MSEDLQSLARKVCRGVTVALGQEFRGTYEPASRVIGAGHMVDEDWWTFGLPSSKSVPLVSRAIAERIRFHRANVFGCPSALDDGPSAMSRSRRTGVCIRVSHDGYGGWMAAILSGRRE
jgi:hypothetical protein